MKEDKFKDFISNNRSSFDTYEEDYDEIWLQIEKEVSRNKLKKSRNFLLKIAASILILVVTGITITRIYYPSPSELGSGNSLSEALMDATYYYKVLIDDKLDQIKANQNEIDPDIFKDIESLDQAFSELQNDLKDNVDNEEVIEAMIQNYKIKLEILESILSELNETGENPFENEENPNDTISI